eukprot:2788278-Alexandrium_andersonii.AAC.1
MATSTAHTILTRTGRTQTRRPTRPRARGCRPAESARPARRPRPDRWRARAGAARARCRAR